MKAHWPNGDVVVIGKQSPGITSEQWNSLELLQQRHDLPDPVEVLPGLGYIGVMSGTMFIGIEPDGHAHT
tara:strand:+ start:598 stop:807 length:210 start_codon:yes stop_codon:yes gene_type:complete